LADSTGEKKHAATPQRRKQAQEQGRFAVSREVNAALMLLTGLGILWFSGSRIVSSLMATMQACWKLDGPPRAEPAYMLEALIQSLRVSLQSLLPLLVGVFLIALMCYALQTRFFMAQGHLRLHFDKLNPWSGLLRFVQSASWSSLFFALLKQAVIVVIIAWNLYQNWSAIIRAGSLEAAPMALLMAEVLCLTFVQIACVFVLLGAVDYGWQWWRHEQSLRMTDEELREELKSSTRKVVPQYPEPR
jgi:flagellar biosynthetic protein FlhB